MKLKLSFWSNFEKLSMVCRTWKQFSTFQRRKTWKRQEFKTRWKRQKLKLEGKQIKTFPNPFRDVGKSGTILDFPTSQDLETSKILDFPTSQDLETSRI